MSISISGIVSAEAFGNPAIACGPPPFNLPDIDAFQQELNALTEGWRVLESDGLLEPEPIGQGTAEDLKRKFADAQADAERLNDALRPTQEEIDAQIRALDTGKSILDVVADQAKEFLAGRGVAVRS